MHTYPKIDADPPVSSAHNHVLLNVKLTYTHYSDLLNSEVHSKPSIYILYQEATIAERVCLYFIILYCFYE